MRRPWFDGMVDPAPIRSRFALLSPHLDERGRRLFAASEARAAGHGGIAAVFRATGIAPSTIGRGLRELDEGEPLEGGWVRREGGGRKTLVAHDPGLLSALLALVSPTERGCPISPLRWTCKSLRQLADALVKQGHPISHTVVGALRKGEGFSLQGNSKTLEGSSHPDRDAQFAHIARSTAAALAEGQPVISVDTKKKELVGPFKNPGREWRPQGTPEQVRVHDFLALIGFRGGDGSITRYARTGRNRGRAAACLARCPDAGEARSAAGTKSLPWC